MQSLFSFSASDLHARNRARRLSSLPLHTQEEVGGNKIASCRKGSRQRCFHYSRSNHACRRGRVAYHKDVMQHRSRN